MVFGLLTAVASLVAEQRLQGEWASVAVAPGLQSTGSVVVHGLSCSETCGTFPDQGSHLCLLHRQADSSPLSDQRSPKFLIQSQECSHNHGLGDFLLLQAEGLWSALPTPACPQSGMLSHGHTTDLVLKWMLHPLNNFSNSFSFSNFSYFIAVFFPKDLSSFSTLFFPSSFQSLSLPSLASSDHSLLVGRNNFPDQALSTALVLSSYSLPACTRFTCFPNY